MDELDARLQALAAHRAAQVPPVDATVLAEPRRAHTRRVVLAVAAVVALALAAGVIALLSASGDDGASVRVPPASGGSTPMPTATTPASTSPSSQGCEGAQPAGTTPVALPGVPSVNGGTSVLTNVQTQRSDCADAVDFLFGNGIPATTVEYANTGGDTAAGPHELVVRFQGRLLEQNFGPGGYSSTDLRPAAPATITSVALEESTADSMTWRITFDRVHPFSVVTRDDGSIVVEIMTPPPTTVVCDLADAGIRLVVPSGLFAETTTVGTLTRPCQSLSRAPFVIAPATDGLLAGVIGVRIAPTDAPTFTGAIVDEHPASIDGRSATVTTTEAGAGSLIPEGAQEYRYVVDWGERGFLVIGVVGTPGPEFDADRRAVDAVAAGVSALG